MLVFRILRTVIIVCFLFIAFLVMAATDYIPKKAYVHRDLLITELDKNFPNIPNVSYLPALIEHESCISLKHSRCFDPTSELKTSREQGVGLGQITRAYNSNGSLRFDSLKELRTKYKRQLAEANWETIKVRPDLQIRMVVLMSKGNFDRLYDVDSPEERLIMADVAYNGGLGGLQKERRLCSLTKGCDPDIWFNNVEKYCLKSKKPLYGNRSVCDISRNHPKDIFLERLPKYERVRFMYKD